MKATVEGDGFSGPKTLVAMAFQTTDYPLIFKPQREGPVQVTILTTPSVELLVYNVQTAVSKPYTLTSDSTIELAQINFCDLQ